MLFYEVNPRDNINMHNISKSNVFIFSSLSQQFVCYRVLVFVLLFLFFFLMQKWYIRLQGEVDDTALDVNFSGNISFDKVLHRYMPEYLSLVPLKLGDLTGETKFSGALLKP